MRRRDISAILLTSAVAPVLLGCRDSRESTLPTASAAPQEPPAASQQPATPKPSTTLTSNTQSSTAPGSDQPQQPTAFDSTVPGYAITGAEIAARAQIVNPGYLPGHFLRYGAKGDGITDDTAALASALLCNQTCYGGGAQYKYLTSQSLKLTNYCAIDGQGCSIVVTADVPALTNATGASVVHPDVRNLTLLTNVASMSSAAIDLIDVSRGTFQINTIDRNAPGASWGYAIRLRALNSVCLWNVFLSVKAECVNTGFIALETENVNQNVFFGPKLINDSTLPIERAIGFQLASDNHFFDADLEALFSGNPASYGVDFNTGCQNKFYGLRTESYANSTNFCGVRFNGSSQNTVVGHYCLGYGSQAPYCGALTGNTYINAGGVCFLSGTTITADVGALSYDSVSDRVKATTSAGGIRTLVQSPALETLDMDDNPISGVQSITLTQAATNGGAATVSLGATTATCAASGSAAALPPAPAAYWIVNVAGKQMKIPLYND